jgi:PhzF family phenazine biosynthesis protein
MARVIPILQVDAFATRPFSGNPAGVVLDADFLSDEDMRQIAREMNVSETAFTSPAQSAGADLRLRWFSPTGCEVRFCGHATVAATHALVESGRLRGEGIVFETLGGLIGVRVERAAGRAVAWLEPALPTCVPYPGDTETVLGALGVTTLGGWASPALTSEGDVLLPMPSFAELRSLAPDSSAMTRVAAAQSLRGLCAVALEGMDPGSRTHSRFFAPHLGIPEDPVTGSVHAAIPVWLWESGVMGNDSNSVRFTAEQGDIVGRPGRLQIEVLQKDRRPTLVRVGGEAVTVVSGTIRLL